MALSARGWGLVRHVPGPPPETDWTPLNLPNLYAWYDPSDAATVTSSGTEIIQLLDKSGNSRTLTPRSPNTGLLNTYQINGLNAMGNDAQNSSRNLASAALPADLSAITTIAVYDNSVADAGQNHRLGFIGGGVVTRSVWGVSYTDNSLRYDGGFNAGVITPVTGVKLRISYGSAATGNVSDIINGVTNIDNQPHGNGWADKGDFIVIGMASASSLFGNSGYLDGSVGEVIIMDGVISGADIANVTAYYAAKWGTPP